MCNEVALLRFIMPLRVCICIHFVTFLPMYVMSNGLASAIYISIINLFVCFVSSCTL